MSAKRKPGQPSSADIARLGPSVAGALAAMDPARRKAVVKYAHGHGFTVAGALSDTPDPLKPRLQSSLKSEALRSVGAAYKPSEKALNDEGNRLANIGVRRRADEAAYNAWAATQRESLMTSARAADGQLAERRQQILDAASAGLQHSQQRVEDEARNQPGRVSDPSQSRALDLSAEQSHARDSLNNQDLQQAMGTQPTQQLAALMAAAMASEKGADAGREADSQKAITDVSHAKIDLGTKRAQDVLSALQGLRDKELTKAQTVQDQAIAAAKLDVDQNKLDNTITQQNRDFGLKTSKLDLDTWIAHHHNSVENAKVQMGYDKIAASHGEKQADRELRRWLQHQTNRNSALDRAAGKKGASPTDRKASVNQASSVATLKDEIIRMHGKGATSIRKNLVDRGASSIQIDVAEDLRVGDGKLSGRGRRKARALGISDATMQHLGWI